MVSTQAHHPGHLQMKAATPSHPADKHFGFISPVFKASPSTTGSSDHPRCSSIPQTLYMWKEIRAASQVSQNWADRMQEATWYLTFPEVNREWKRCTFCQDSCLTGLLAKCNFGANSMWWPYVCNLGCRGEVGVKADQDGQGQFHSRTIKAAFSDPRPSYFQSQARHGWLVSLSAALGFLIHSNEYSGHTRGLSISFAFILEFVCAEKGKIRS